SSFAWEREALDFLRQYFPAHEPWRAWSNFEFIDDEGRVNEVDLLALTPSGLILLEIKSRPGTLQGDAHSWTWTTDGRQLTVDNPLPLANRKAKRLASVLRRQEGLGRSSSRPATVWIEPAIFLSAVHQPPRLDPGTARKVFLRGHPSALDDTGIIGALIRASELGLGRAGAVDANAARAIVRAMELAGIRSPGRGRRVGDYELGQVLTEGDDWQDFAAKHASTGVARRVRIYPYARATSPEARERIARTAEREFRVLEGIDHPGIVRVFDYRETEHGPALVFEYAASASRLDRFLAARLGTLPLETRLDLLRQLAEAVAYAHGKHVYHRGLAPQNVLVRERDREHPRLQVMNWQLAGRGAGSGSASPVTTGTQHIEERFSDPAKAYLAPEALSGEGGEAAGVLADIFSLGAIAYHLVAGRPPAEGALDLSERLRAGGGLRLSDAVDGVGPDLADLVRTSTTPNVRERISSAAEFLEYLSCADAKQRPPAPTPEIADPSTAKPGDRLDGGLTVVKRLGRGGTADALLVRRDNAEEERVLKIAVDAAHAERVRAEAEILHRLHHQNIVRFFAETEIKDRPGILMERAGEKTLAQWLRGKDPLSLDLMRRFGEHLLGAVGYLEDNGVAHRDIKPDNIGVAKAGGSGAYRLVLFDFSLARTAPESITAGTRPYLDPFLAARRPPRWDLHAERYAAAVTLHEMLTGAPPVFGDGLTDPQMTDDEATIAIDRFDPALRDGLAQFFSRALCRDPAGRFGNAEEMLRAWRQAFEPMDRTALPADSIELIARRLSRQSLVAEVGYGVEARDVLDRMGVHNVQQLLDVPRLKFRYLTGVGDRIRKEIRERAKRL
ncbi:MAG: BREX system serine/threonine kinase PglW, partial [Acetobacteraceae bacterium]